MGKHRLAFVAFDSAKDKHAVAIADDGRDGEVRYLDEIDNSPDAVRKLVAKLAAKYRDRKAASSRAIAVVATGVFLPLVMSRR